jgi:hypothetical protein
MKQCLFFLMIALMSFSSCKKDKAEDITPRSEVPTQLVGKWLYGSFSMTEFWQYNGSYSGNAFELAVAFDFKPEGNVEFYFVTGGTTYGCRTEALVYKKGTVRFNDDSSFTIYPTEGRARGFYKGCASSYQNYDKKMERTDLPPETYYYTLERDSSGKQQLVIRFKQNDTNSSNFRPANW